MVATQDLEAGDFLVRFKAEASHARGSRSISARPVFGNCCYTWDSSHLYAVFLFLFRWFACVCDDLSCFASHV